MQSEDILIGEIIFNFCPQKWKNFDHRIHWWMRLRKEEERWGSYPIMGYFIFIFCLRKGKLEKHETCCQMTYQAPENLSLNQDFKGGKCLNLLRCHLHNFGRIWDLPIHTHYCQTYQHDPSKSTGQSGGPTGAHSKISASHQAYFLINATLCPAVLDVYPPCSDCSI